MAFMIKREPQGRTRQIGKRGFRKNSFICHYFKSGEVKSLLDSRLEVIAGIALDLDPEVTALKAQPFSIDVTTGEFLFTKEQLDKHRKNLAAKNLKGVYYTPDFSIQMRDGSSRVLEIKDSDWAEPTDEYKAKLDAGIAIMKNQGITFELLANKFDETYAYVQNFKLLHNINHEIQKATLSPSLLAFKSQEDAMKQISHEMFSTGEMRTIESIAATLNIKSTEICIAIVFGIFKAPVWTEQINVKTLLAGVESGHFSFIRYQDFGLRERCDG